ncbi:DUF1972 domain-containing protein [Blautia marasmi]|uniref:DUF1972 domain-containing protein n=1 Tax=Blautia marasmi TaxID=1917868 RepID=UPI000CF25AC3|nr:DUF1972 domain-containing protein [Blautia marasmi]
MAITKKNVFIIGLRGYTQNYGGWETFAHGLLDNWEDDDVHFYAFEKVDNKEEQEFIEYNEFITCIRVCESSTGSSAMMKYDKNCTDYAIQYVQERKIENPIFFYLGLRVGPYVWLKKKKIKKLGIKLMENPAGVEWKRTKWNKLVQIYAFVSAIMMAKSMDLLTCDNEGIQEVYQKLLIGKKPILDYVAYGVDLVPAVAEPMPEKVKDFFNKWRIEKDEYYLVLGRYIPENNYEMMIKGFMKSKTDKKLLIITNYKAEIQKFHQHILDSTHYPDDDRVIMAGTLYDKEILHYVRQYARGYIHGHSVGGTNPGLLEAMAETNVNLLNDVSFNRYVGGDAAVYFKDEDSLKKLIEEVDMLTEKKILYIGNRAKNRMIEKYSWKKIVTEYSRIFRSI